MRLLAHANQLSRTIDEWYSAVSGIDGGVSLDRQESKYPSDIGRPSFSNHVRRRDAGSLSCTGYPLQNDLAPCELFAPIVEFSPHRINMRLKRGSGQTGQPSGPPPHISLQQDRNNHEWRTSPQRRPYSQNLDTSRCSSHKPHGLLLLMGRQTIERRRHADKLTHSTTGTPRSCSVRFRRTTAQPTSLREHFHPPSR